MSPEALGAWIAAALVMLALAWALALYWSRCPPLAGNADDLSDQDDAKAA